MVTMYTAEWAMLVVFVLYIISHNLCYIITLYSAVIYCTIYSTGPCFILIYFTVAYFSLLYNIFYLTQLYSPLLYSPYSTPLTPPQDVKCAVCRSLVAEFHFEMEKVRVFGVSSTGTHHRPYFALDTLMTHWILIELGSNMVWSASETTLSALMGQVAVGLGVQYHLRCYLFVMV